MNNDREFLGTEPVGKLLARLALPTVTAQLINMLYNIVDRIYIGHIKDVGATALTGVGVCMPLILIVSAFAALISNGGAPRASIAMGKKDYESAEATLGNSFTAQILISVLLTAVLLIWNRDFLMAFGASENTIQYAVDYMNIYAVGTIFVQLTLGMNAFITAQGFAKTGMLSVLIGAVTNIVLDPILIFGFHMGVQGAALATIISQALSCIARSKTFDNGTVCASEQSIIVEKALESQVKAEAQRQGFYFMDTEQAGKLAKLLFRPSGALNPEIVGKPAEYLAKLAGFSVPQGTKILVAREEEAGPAQPYSMEKLCPVLAFYVMENEEAVLNMCVKILTHEGSGHTFAMHASDEGVIRRFAAKIPVSRFLVNTPAALGGIGATTGLFPALTLGCGAVGGSSSSNNISPMDLINIRRVAWDTGEQPAQKTLTVNEELVQLLTEKILQRLG